MDIHYVVRRGEVLPYLESFVITRQAAPCPPNILDILNHKLIALVSEDPKIREFDFPFKTCPIHVTLDVLQQDSKECDHDFLTNKIHSK